MWQNPRGYDDPFTSSIPTQTSLNVNWTRLSRPSSRRITPVKLALLLFVIFAIIIIRDRLLSHSSTNFQHESASYIAFQPPEPHRISDTIDAFESYKFRHICNVSSLDLHAPFSPLCNSRASMLRAMSSGGRIGNDAPYMPRGCDMRWFTTEEICDVLARFDRVVLVGDSMIRHLMGSINILIRKDLGYGAVTDWNFSPQEKRECFCNEQFDVKACSVQGIYKTADVLAHDPTSLACKRVNVQMEEIQVFPSQEENERLKALTSGRRNAFVLGHGLWSDLDMRRTLEWLDAILGALKPKHALFVTPNAAGKLKPDEWIVSQGNKALVLYEEAVGTEAMKRGIEHLGTWNMSIQSNKYDGVHLDMKGNLVKAMMVLNWLNLIE